MYVLLKKASLVAASFAAAIGVAVAIAAPAHAQNYGYYDTEAECLAAKGARTDLSCGYSPGENGTGVWVLTDGRGGG